jgi:hypothetical protein
MRLSKLGNILWTAGLIFLFVSVVIGFVNGINYGQTISEIIVSNIAIIIAFIAFGAIRIFLFRGESKK